MRLLSLLFVSAIAFGQTLEVKRVIPHSGYSEGLTYHENYLWHALPKRIVKIDPANGTVLQTFKPASAYSESLVWWKGGLWNLSYKTNGIYFGKLVNNKLVFEKRGEVPEKHGWGITHNGQHLIVTGNYSNRLYFLDPKTLKVVRTISTPVKDLEDLAWDGEGIWTSSFSTHRGKIFWVDPTSGEISKFYSLPDVEECPVIDGMAHHKGTLFITGKHCSKIYVVKKPTDRMISSKEKK